jgi:hypothetical protein
MELCRLFKNVRRPCSDHIDHTKSLKSLRHQEYSFPKEYITSIGSFRSKDCFWQCPGLIVE